MFTRTLVVLPLVLWFAATLASHEDTWAGGGVGRALSLAFAALFYIPMLVGPLIRFRESRAAFAVGWTVGAVLAVAGIIS